MPRLTRDNIAWYSRRIERLAPASRPRWGRMDAPLLVRHLRRALEISLGEVACADRSVAGLRSLVRWLFFNVFSIWPPSRRRAPGDWLPPAAASFDVEKGQLLSALERFAAALAREPGRRAVHPLLGPLSLGTWSRVHGVHFNHHFRQFRLVQPWEAPEYWAWLAIPALAVLVWLLRR